ILAAASRYWKLAPVLLEACLIAPVTRARAGSTPARAVAFEVSTDMFRCPASRTRPSGSWRALSPEKRSRRRAQWAVMVNEELSSRVPRPGSAAYREDALRCIRARKPLFLVDRARIEQPLVIDKDEPCSALAILDP